MSTRELRITVDETGRDVSAALVLPRRAVCLYVMAHGAGAGMTHPLLAAIADGLAAQGVATLRFQFPYMQDGRKAPDREPVLTATVRAALDAGARRGLPVVAGGKSMGGRMTSRLLADSPHPAVRGVVFLGFPLHAAGSPGIERAEHLDRVQTPMLFVQGTRDRLARLDAVRGVVAGLRDRAALHVVDDGDHSFHVRKRPPTRERGAAPMQRSPRTDADAVAEIVTVAARWMHGVAARWPKS